MAATFDTIAYTHWAYFDNKGSSQAAAHDLPDFVTRIRQSSEKGVWLLLAGRDVPIEELVERHRYVQEIVERHGGLYDGGEATFDGLTGVSLPDPMLTGEVGS